MCYIMAVRFNNIIMCYFRILHRKIPEANIYIAFDTRCIPKQIRKSEYVCIRVYIFTCMNLNIYKYINITHNIYIVKTGLKFGY